MRKTLTVTELTALVKNLLERDPMLGAVSVVGEVSGLKVYQSRHAYFTLKDADASIKCAWFGAGSHSKISFKDGDQVVASGRITVYAQRGEYQLTVHEVIPKGLGELAAAFEKLKEKLKNEGLFDESRKVPIPALPHRIALIASPTSAALQDLLNIHNRNAPHVEIKLFPSLMQGDGAPPELIRALALAQADPTGFDLIIIARGGGSIEDLWCFNDENLARAIANSIIPTISGVGHESDVTIADFVADLRAPTPTAAMDIATGKWPEVLDAYAALCERLPILAGRELRAFDADFSRVAELSAIRAIVSRIDDSARTLDDGLDSLAAVPAVIARLGETARAALDHRALGAVMRDIAEFDRAIATSRATTARAVADRVASRADSLTALRAKLDSCDYERQLTRGFSVVTRAADGAVVESPDDTEHGDILEVRASKGAYRAVRD